MREIYFGDSQIDAEKPVFSELFAFECGPSKMNKRLDALINSGEIVSCYFGGNEIGPRALCNRSLICAANNRKSVLTLNSVVKREKNFVR